MPDSFVYTLRNGLHVNVEYKIGDDGFADVTAITPLGMPYVLAHVDEDEAEIIAVEAVERAWFA